MSKPTLKSLNYKYTTTFLYNIYLIYGIINWITSDINWKIKITKATGTEKRDITFTEDNSQLLPAAHKTKHYMLSRGCRRPHQERAPTISEFVVVLTWTASWEHHRVLHNLLQHLCSFILSAEYNESTLPLHRSSHTSELIERLYNQTYGRKRKTQQKRSHTPQRGS